MQNRGLRHVDAAVAVVAHHEGRVLEELHALEEVLDVERQQLHARLRVRRAAVP